MSAVDQRNRFADEVFSYRTAKTGDVFITWQGKTVTTLRGSAAELFLRKVANLEQREAQLLMAKATGNFKRGNER